MTAWLWGRSCALPEGLHIIIIIFLFPRGIYDPSGDTKNCPETEYVRSSGMVTSPPPCRHDEGATESYAIESRWKRKLASRVSPVIRVRLCPRYYYYNYYYFVCYLPKNKNLGKE